MQVVAKIGERALIDRIRSRLPPDPGWVQHGIGDDAAVIEPARGTLDVVTTDALVEGVHFERSFGTAEDLGYKALAVNLSDLAAMGATPRAALLSVALPGDMPVADVDHLLDGLLDLAGHHQVALIGGNVTRSPGPLFIGITAIGAVRPRRTLARAGGRAGDALYVSGSIGAAGAGLAWLRKHAGARDPDAEGMADCVRRFLRPEPRVRIGALIGRNRIASAAVDLSDGLGDAVNQLAAASGLGATIEADALPIDPAASRWLARAGLDPVTAALAGGEDYELLVAVPVTPRSRTTLLQRLAGALPMTRIGTLTKEPTRVLRRSDGDSPLPSGYAHF